MASRRKGSFFVAREAKAMILELVEEYLTIYNKAGIMSRVTKIQILLLAGFNLALFAYSFLDSVPQIPEIFFPQNLHLPFTVLFSIMKKPTRLIKHFRH